MIWTLDKIDMDVRAKAKLYSSLNNKLGFDIVSNKFILITAHRRESFGEGFISICVAIKKLAIAYPTINFVYPVHLNPNVQKPVNDNLAGLSNVKLIEPLDYKSFVVVLRESYFILTDSGGIQEEAPGLGKPVLVLRDTTERPEAIQAGVVKLIGTNSEKIIEEVKLLIESEEHYKSMSLASNPYGDGHASEKVVNAIKRTYL
jgi:UDP-N-acetylglucosamine 2-epimerase (non-hydrolysing)